jgi:hypothetical protein
MKAAKALSEGTIKPIGVAGVIKTHSTKMSNDEKTLAENILWGFVFGIPVKTYAVAGGLSADAYERIKQQAIDSATPSETNVTPAQSSGIDSFNLPQQTVPASVNTLIDQYINKQLIYPQAGVSKETMKSTAKTLARIIYALSTKNAKIEKYNSSKKSFDTMNDHIVYRAVRQESVVKILITPYNSTKSFAQNYPDLK